LIARRDLRDERKSRDEERKETAKVLSDSAAAQNRLNGTMESVIVTVKIAVETMAAATRAMEGRRK
jgi:hypothetical protein